MIVSILGCGWLGLPLGAALVNAGYTVNGSATSDSKHEQMRSRGINPFVIDLNKKASDDAGAFFHCEVMIIAIAWKSVSDIEEAIEHLNEAFKGKPLPQIMMLSSISVYGDRNEVVDELTAPLPDSEAGNRMRSIELSVRNKFPEAILLRLAGLVGPGRHPGNFFRGRQGIPGGMNPVNLVHADDCIGMISELIGKVVHSQVINLVSPDHPSRQSFYAAAANSVGEEAPGFEPSCSGYKLVSNHPGILPDEFQYKVTDWMEWLSSV